MERCKYALICLLIVACESSLPPFGIWGSELARMTILENGANIQFTCASGSIPTKIKLDKNYTFTLEGGYRPSSGVPPLNEGFDESFKATYSGKVTGEKMELKVIVDSLQLKLHYSLKFGNETNVPICP